MKEIEINCKGSRKVDLNELRPFQGNLKELTKANYYKLRGLIQTMGFSFPIFVWEAPDEQKYILDGHQRVRTLTRMVTEEGYICPEIPIADVKADSFQEAKKKLMAAVSGFGNVTKDGLYEFLSENEWELGFLDESFSIPDVDIGDFKSEYFDHGGGKPDVSDIPYDDPDIAMSDEIDPRDNYVVLVWDDIDKFKEMVEKLGLLKQKQNISASNNPKFLKYGIGRIIPADKFFERLET